MYAAERATDLGQAGRTFSRTGPRPWRLWNQWHLCSHWCRPAWNPHHHCAPL